MDDTADLHVHFRLSGDELFWRFAISLSTVKVEDIEDMLDDQNQRSDEIRVLLPRIKTLYFTMNYASYRPKSEGEVAEESSRSKSEMRGYDDFPYYQGLQVIYRKILETDSCLEEYLARYNAVKYSMEGVKYVEYTIGREKEAKSIIQGTGKLINVIFLLSFECLHRFECFEKDIKEQIRSNIVYLVPN